MRKPHNKENFMNLLENLEIPNEEKVFLLWEFLNLDTSDMAKLLINFAYEELDQEDVAKDLSLEYMLNGHVEIDTVTQGYGVMGHEDFIYYMSEEYERLGK